MIIQDFYFILLSPRLLKKGSKLDMSTIPKDQVTVTLHVAASSYYNICEVRSQF